MVDVGVQHNPFPGIRSFEPEEDFLFFGRETQIREIGDILVKKHFLALIGYSGSGKSSLIKAGIVPAIVKGNLPESAATGWEVIYFRPENDPFQSLATAISHTFESYTHSQAEDLTATANFLQQEDTDLRAVYQKYCSTEKTNWLIVIDQFEEIFRLRQYSNETSILAQTQKFINVFLSGLKDPTLPVYLILSMRSDFLDNCTEFSGLPEAINQGFYLLPKVTRSGIRDIIVNPILVCGGQISDELLNTLLNDVEGNQDQLPILQHAMMRTWDYWKQHKVNDEPIDFSHYEAIGTMDSALSVHAEEVYRSFPSERLQKVTEKIFKALTDVTIENREARRPVQVKSLVTLANATEQDVEDVIEEFRKPGRAFLLPNYNINLTSDTVIDIAHESLMRVWQRLKEWVQEETKSAELYLRLSKSAALYQQGKTGLWVNPDLALAINWQQEQKPNEAWASRYDPAFDRTINFLEYCKKEARFDIEQKENKQKRELKRTQAFLVILGAAAFISLLLFLYSFNEGIKAAASEKRAKENEKIAYLASKQALQERKEALLQQQIAIQQQQITEEEKLISEEQKANALKQKTIAEEQTQEAILQRKKAIGATEQAVLAKNEAEVQRNEAVVQRRNAEEQKSIAETSEKNTQRLRLLSVARTIAIESTKIKLTQSDDLPALLALQAYFLNKENGGFENNPNIFNALSEIGDEKPVLGRHIDAVRAITISGNGSIVASASDDGTVKIWHRSAGGAFTMVQQLQTGEVKNKEIRSLAISPDAAYVVAGVMDGRLIKWQLSQSKPQAEVLKAHESTINEILFYPGQNNFITVSSDGFFKTWDMGSVTPTFTRNLYSPVLAAALSANGSKVACGRKDGKVSIVELAALASVPAEYNMDTKAVQAVAFDPDGKLLVTGNAAGIIKIWTVADLNRRPTELIGHISGINAIMFNPADKTFATGSYDKTIRIWTLGALQENPIVLDENDAWVMDLVYTPNGHSLISASADKTVRLFSINKEDLAQKICEKVKRNLTEDEWANYIGNDIIYQKTCKEKP